MTIAMHTTPPTKLLDACGVYYRDLNAQLRDMFGNGGQTGVTIRNVCGQRYIGTAVRQSVQVDIHGTPGNDLGAFMDGPHIAVYGNAQDACGNTLNSGEIIVHGRAGDITGYSMRGGKIMIRGDVGYRAGIHMKEYGERKPILVVGGTAQPFLGEYMAGGIILVLGLTLAEGELHKTTHIGTGMHGGVIYLRGRFEPWQLGREVGTICWTKPTSRLWNPWCTSSPATSVAIQRLFWLGRSPSYSRSPCGRMGTCTRIRGRTRRWHYPTPRCHSFGSRARRSPSPRRLNPSTVTKIAIPGAKD